MENQLRIRLGRLQGFMADEMLIGDNNPLYIADLQQSIKDVLAQLLLLTGKDEMVSA